MHSPDMTIMIKAAERAARSLLRDFSEVEKLQVSMKGPGDFVSRADVRAEEIIVEILEEARPDYRFLLEEGGEKGPDDSPYRWIIDPLDGTKNFLYSIPHWCISIGLEKNGEMIAGVILDPVKEELFIAEKGHGAFMNRDRLKGSGRRDLNMAAIATGGHFRDKNHLISHMRECTALMPRVQMLRRMGSSALNMAYVAAGRLDVFWMERMLPWDIAAGVALIREAGGVVTDQKMGQDYFDERTILAANKNLHGPFAKLLRDVRSS